MPLGWREVRWGRRGCTWRVVDARTGKEPLEHEAETPRPGIFIVDTPWDAQVAEVDAVLPAAGQEAAIEQIGIAQVAQPFG